MPADKKIGILTARQASLTPAHLKGVGINGLNLAIQGMEHAREFTEVFIKGKTTLDQEQCRAEMTEATRKLISRHPDVAAIVLECTNMPPYTGAVRIASGGLPVFDSVTLLNAAWESCAPKSCT